MLNRHLIHAAAAGALGLSLAACTSLPVTTDANPSMSVSNCHTYAFAKEFVANANQPAAYGNPLNAERLRIAIESNLAARGIILADRATADCIVGYAMGSRQVFNDYYSSFGPGWGLGYGWGYRGGFYGGGWGWDGPYVSDETRIAVDIFDAKSRTPIWHASVNQSVGNLTGPNAEAKINAGTAAIFAKFPVAGPLPVSGRTAT
jgi:hypothetical protein